MGSIVNRNNNNIKININKSSTIFKGNKKFFIVTNLKKNSILDKKDNMNNTNFIKDFFFFLKSSNLVYNKSIMNMNMVTPTIKRINRTKTNSNNNMTSTTSEFYAKIFPIKQLWNYEINNIITKGYNGYNNKKYKEMNIDQGHVEIEEETSLYLYGNCLKILAHIEFYEKINTLSFSYFCYDYIMSKKILEFIKNFKNIISIKFSNNNIFSLYQLVKLESFENLEKLSINENEICNGYLLKYFILYRLNNLKYFNNNIVKQSEINLSRNIFASFDKLISIKEKEKITEKSNDENKDNKSIILINNKEENKNEKIKKEIINNSNSTINNNDENYDYINDENKYKFFDFTKYNLSIAIEEIIYDEDNIDI